MKIEDVAQQLVAGNKKITLIFAFNGTGKTRLSVAFKDATKAKNGGNHAGVYYNAYSEDLFYWDNDDENDGTDIRLCIRKSSLNRYHASLDEENLRNKLAPYKPDYDFKFKFYDDPADGMESVQFFLAGEEAASDSIKISRGEEQIFIWCFFLSLFDIEGWTGELSSHFFIDDPVSSLDDHNIFITAASVMDLIDNHFQDRKIIITTHHVGFFAILCDWLKKGEKASSYTNDVQLHILKKSNGALQLLGHDKDVFLYHLELLQTLKNAIDQDQLFAYHFAILRQVLENIASFLGVGRVSYVLEQLGFDDTDEIARIVNTLSHKNAFRYEAKILVPDNETLFKEIFSKIQGKYHFVLH